MKWKECRATRREIDQAEANQQLSAEALAHAASCAACRAFQGERAHLRTLLGSLEPVAVPADFDFRLRARIATQSAGSSSSRFYFGSVLLTTPAIAAAVIFAALALSIALFVQRGTNRPPTTASNQTLQTDSPSREPATQENREDIQTLAENRSDERIGYQPRRRAQIKVGRSPQSGSATDFSASRATSLRQGQPNEAEVLVTAPLKPMVLSLEDDKGATRTFSLPPVSFGSQRLLDGRAVPVSLNNAKNNPRVW